MAPAAAVPPLATVISDSGVTTQNTNNSTANVIDKPEAKSVANIRNVTHANNNTTVTNEATKAGKNIEKVHNRGVYNTNNIPESIDLQPQQVLVPRTGNATMVATPLKANAPVSVSGVNIPSPPIQLPSPAEGKTVNNSTAMKRQQKWSSTTTTSKSVAAANITAAATPSTITTTAVPKKPEITFSVDDDPHLKSIRDRLSSKQAHGPANEANGAFSEPIVLQSSEMLDDDYKGRNYIMPIIGLIFAVPIFLILANFLSRRLKNYWSKRNYQRMDYLINEMYN